MLLHPILPGGQTPNRRQLQKQLGALSFVLSGAAEDKLRPVRAITRGPEFHWFGYYDKLEFDPTDRAFLAWKSNSRTGHRVRTIPARSG